MKDKILQAIENVYAHLDDVVSIQKSGPEFYFIYNNRMLSVSFNKDKAAYYFYIYPRWRGKLQDLIDAMNIGDVDPGEYSVYSGNTPEARATFQKLYDAMQRKYLNIDSVIDDLLAPPKESSRRPAPSADDDVPF